jgi:hypothetical protein
VPQRSDPTRRFALAATFLSTCAIAVGYLAAFSRTGTPSWAPWFLAFGIPGAIGGIMMLGATRGRSGVGQLKVPFAFVFIILAIGFGAALAIPPEDSTSSLWLGLPTRAAIVIYGIGLLPIIVLPIAYALTFETQTLSSADLERVRSLASERRVSEENSTPAAPQ